MAKNELLEQQISLEVDKIRQEHFKKYGVKQDIIKEAAINELAETMPTNIDDVKKYVNGGMSRDAYAERIFNVIETYRTKSQIIDGKPDTNFKNLLTDLSTKLVDMGSRNKKLCLLDLPRGYADVSYIDINEVLKGKFSIKVCDRNKSDEESKRFDEFSAIAYESNSKMRDSGQNSLYLAYLFLEAKLPDSDFNVRSALTMIPVTIERERSTMKLKCDESRDMLVNTDLVLFALKKRGDINIKIPTDKISDLMESYNIDDVSTTTLLREFLTKFYSDHEINLNFTSMEPQPFTEYATKEYENVATTICNVIPNLILGTFEASNSSIKRDLSLMANNADNLPVNVAELLKNSCDETYKLKMYDESPDEKVGTQDISESDILYINSLNSAQENIIKALETENTIVIKGPPGTGKSQTICDIIVTEATRGKTILVVAEKRVALDVIKSRLGLISDYVLMLPDSNNKDEFYDQVERAIKTKKTPDSVDLSQYCSSIDSEINSLSKIYDALYTPLDGFEVEPYKLYATGRKIDVSTKNGLEEYNMIIKAIPDSLMSATYFNLDIAHKESKAERTRKIAMEYITLIRGFPWLASLKIDLSEIEVSNMARDIENLASRPDTENRNLLKRFKPDNEKREFQKKYMVDGSQIDAIIYSPDAGNIFDIYNRYRTTRSAFDTKDNLVKDYSIAAYDICNGDQDQYLIAIEKVFDAIITKKLFDFSSKHGDVVGIMNGFDSSIERIEQMTDLKMENTFINVQASLIDSIHNLDSKIQDVKMILDKPNRFSISKFISRIPMMSSFRVWLMTPESVSDILPLKNGMFDFVIIDEASQMYLEKGIPSVYRGNKVVIAGDNKQLRPSNVGSSRPNFAEDPTELEDRIDAALEQESLLDMARFRYPCHVLNFHYRSKFEELIAFSNATFYDNELFVSPNVKVTKDPPIEYHNVKGIWEEQQNNAEAEFVIERIVDLLKNRTENETIGVVTFNTRQRDCIIDLLDKYRKKDPDLDKLVESELHRTENGEDKSLFIKNIENVQGDERDIIIFSISYAYDRAGRFQRKFGILNMKGGENRINVAISRAKKKIIVVASIEPTEFNVDGVLNKGPKVLGSYLRYAKAVSEKDEEAVRNILSQNAGEHAMQCKSNIAIEQLAEFLESKGYKIKKNVGISTYNLDLAVYDSQGYIMGIEADTSIYPDMPSARGRDVHRLRYLRGRGWKICRFWVSEFWRDKDSEFNRILSYLQSE